MDHSNLEISEQSKVTHSFHVVCLFCFKFEIEKLKETTKRMAEYLLFWESCEAHIDQDTFSKCSQCPPPGLIFYLIQLVCKLSHDLEMLRKTSPSSCNAIWNFKLQYWTMKGDRGWKDARNIQQSLLSFQRNFRATKAMGTTDAGDQTCGLIV